MRRRDIASLALAVLLWAGTAAGEDKPADATKPQEPGPWQPQVTLGLNLSQGSFSQNWAGGDKGSIIWIFNGDLAAQRQFSRVLHWSNELLLAFGQTTQQVEDPEQPGHNVWTAPTKSTDQIQFESTARLTLGGFVDPYGSLRLDSQFQDESNPAGTLMFNPVKLTESAGIARVLARQGDHKWVTRVGLASRQVFGRAFVDTTGTRTQGFVTLDGGVEWQTTADQPLLHERVLYKAKLRVYQAAFFSKSDALRDFDRRESAVDPSWRPVGDYWKRPDVDLQNSFTAQISKILAVNLAVQWVYDKFDAATNIDDTLPLEEQRRLIELGTRRAGQFRETLSIALTYRVL